VIRNDRTGVIVEVSDRSSINGIAFWRNGKDGIATWETVGAKTGAKFEEKFAGKAAKTEGVGKEGLSKVGGLSSTNDVNKAITKSLDDIFKAGKIPKASELKQFAESQGWKPLQTEGGPLKYIDENGIPRVTIKQGSTRAPGSGSPHVELKDTTGQRIDSAGNTVTRKSIKNHMPIDYDL